MAKKILLITYYWPPSGGVAVLRWLESTKYFADQGWDITVVHPTNAAYTSIDNGGIEEINPRIKQIALPIIEPGGLYAKLTQTQKSNSSQVFKDSNTWWKKLALKIRANLFIPDARMLWIKPTVKYLKKHLEKNNYDVIISNGTPHSCHLIALGLKQSNPELNWVADFRDPWLEIDYFESLPLSKKARKKHEQLEREVVQTADLVTTVSKSWANLFSGKGARNTAVFTNGYNSQLIASVKQQNPQTDDFIISHVGTITEDRNPTNLWDALDDGNYDFKIKLVGSIIEKVNGLSVKNLEVTPSTVPHKKALEIMQNSNILLLLNNKEGETAGRIPAKVFEYLAFEKPILYFGPLDNDAVVILKESGMAKFYTYEDKVDIVELNSWLQNPPQPIDGFADRFSREKISKAYGDCLIKTFEL